MRTVPALMLSTLCAASLAAQRPVVTEQTSGTTQLLQAVSAVNDHVVWVSGHGGVVARTTDGGDHWTILPVPGTEKLEFRDIHAVSPDVAWAMSAGPGPQSRIYRTTDGGATWGLQFTNADTSAFYDCITFFDSKTGVAFSDAVGDRTMILRTSDAGEHWDLIPASAAPAALKGEGGFAASGGCLVSSGSKRGWVATGSPEARMLRTDDAGKSWRPFATPFVRSAQGAGMTATSWLDEKRGIGVASNISARGTSDTSSAAVGISDDGGMTWKLVSRPSAPGGIYGVTWVPGAGRSTAVASALSGLQVTTNAGVSWTAATTGPYWSVGAAGRRVWGVGPRGRITRLDF
ncbi:MAG: oxidoreductase [Gemmatimonadota bacterium]